MMRALRLRLVNGLAAWCLPIAATRPQDFYVGTPDDHYLERWYLTPWSRYERGTPPASLWQALKRRLPNVYLHRFLRSDDDRALHDHPWFNCSILLAGSYVEHTIAAGGVHHHAVRRAGDVKFRKPTSAHRIEVTEPCWTLFVTGPVIRNWGFHCPHGWRPWQVFVDHRDSGNIGRGCE